MEICRVTGCVTSTAKDASLTGLKLLVVQPTGGGTSLVAVDTVGAGLGELVLVVRGGAARQTPKTKEVPTDAAIVAILDPYQWDGRGEPSCPGEAE